MDCGEQLRARIDARGAKADFLDPDDGAPSILILGSVLLGALVWYHIVPKRRAGGWAPKVV